MSLLWPSGLVCKLGGNPLPVIGETEVELMDADVLPVLVTKDFPHELLIGSDAIRRGNGKIDYGTKKVTLFGHIQTSSPVQPLSESCCHPYINDVIKGYTDVLDEDLFNHGHWNLITLTIKLNGCWLIKLRAYSTPLWIRKVVYDVIKECNLDFNITMGCASHIDRQKDESYLDLLHQLL